MTDKTNVIPLFGKKEINKGSNQLTQQVSEVIDLVDENLNLKGDDIEEVELAIDASFTIENVIGAIVSNKFYNVDFQIKQGVLNNPKHDYKESMTILFSYIIDSLNKILVKRGQEAEWGGATLNNILVKVKGTNFISLELSVELYVLEDMSTAIVFLEGEKEVYAIINNEIKEVS